MAQIATEQLVIGTLIKNPSLLLQSDKYQITSDSFNTVIYKYIFWAIENLADGAKGSLTPYEIEQWILTSPTASAVYNARNGKQALVDCQEVPVSSFDGLYSRFQKENLIRDLEKDLKIDTSGLYVGTPITDAEIKIDEKFANSTVQDLIDTVEMDLSKIKSKYVLNDTSEVRTIANGLADLVESFETDPEIGLPLQGHLFNHIVSGALLGTLYIRSAASGVGKALPNSTKIPTPNGWKLVQDIEVGDELFDAYGKPTKVLGVFPQGALDVWEITFKDGRTARCSKDHLWSFWTNGQREKAIIQRDFVTETVEQMLKRGIQKSDSAFRLRVPQNKAVHYQEKELSIPPYSFGLMLGDGSFRQQPSNKAFQYSSENEELPQAIAKEMGWTLKRSSQKNFTWYYSLGDKNVWVEDVLVDYPDLINTYSHEIYIPTDYLQSGYQQRLDLLNGLLDSDGSMGDNGAVTYCTNSTRLRDNVIELARSLGYKANFSVDNHKSTSEVYIVRIMGTPEDKNKLFRLTRKREKMQKWYDNGKRKEKNHYNAIVSIRQLDYQEEMTCFYVDNPEHLFLMNDFIVTHNTRSAAMDAFQLAFPIRFNTKTMQWEANGMSEKVMIIITEQNFAEIQKMCLAYLTGINESKIKKNLCDEDEKKRLKEAIVVLEHYQENLHIVRVPSPTISLVKQLVRENVKRTGIKYVFYDYIFISPSLLSEFKGVNLRNDEILLMFSDALKQLAVELDIFIMSSTQVNASADDNKNIRSESSIAGSRAVINKGDVGCIMARPTPDELGALGEMISQFGIIPNLTTDIYKVRGGDITQVRIWSYMDLGTLRRTDLLVTDSQLRPLEIEYIKVAYELTEEEKEKAQKVLREVELC